MAIVQFVLALAVLGLLYSRMIKRETPGPISKAQAVLPVVFGVLSVPPREYALAVAVPVAIHTLLDAFTATNRLLDSTGDAEQMFGLILGLAALAAMFVLQIRVIRRFKRNAEAYCGMRVN
jgi:hypothetical protein